MSYSSRDKFWRRKQNRNHRRGLETVELAITLPFMTLLVFGLLQISAIVHLKHSLRAASYEAVRVASRYDGTYEKAYRAAEDHLAARKIKNYKIAFAPAAPEKIEPGEPIEVIVLAHKENIFGPRPVPMTAWVSSEPIRMQKETK
jgi:hypothetical protein